jgi:foldase protein PrsA
MFKKSLVATTALVVAVAIPSIVYGAGQAKPAEVKKAPAAKAPAAKTTTKPTQSAKPTAPAKPAISKVSQEENLKKFKAAPDSTIVAIVGDKKITKGELTKIMWDWAAPQILDEYMNYQVVVQALAKEGLKVTDADIQNKMKDVRLAPGDSIEAMMQRMKQPRARVESAYTIPIALQKITEKNSTVTDAEYAEYIHARHILIRATPSNPTVSTPPSEADTSKADQDAKAKAEKCIAEIKAGKSFEEATKEYSDDTMTKDKGGDLGWFRSGEMFPEVSDAAFSMKPGDISAPIKSYFGYHIVKVEKLGKDANADEKSTLKQRIMKQKMDQGMQKLFVDLKAKTKFENLISPTLPEVTQPRTAPVTGGMAPGSVKPNPTASQPNVKK